MSLGSPSVPSAPTLNSTSGLPGNSFIDPFALANLQQTYNVGAGIANQAGSQESISTPGYNTSYTQTGTGPGGVPLYNASTTFSNPQQQTNYNQYLQNQGMAGGTMVPWLTGQGQSLIGQATGGPFFPGAATSQDAAFKTLQAQGVGNILSNYDVPAAQEAQGTTRQGLPWLSNSAAAQAGGAGETVRYANQDPSQIGNMTSGLTGERMQAAVGGIQPFQQTQRDQLDNQMRNQGLHPGMPGYDNAMRSLDTSQNLAISSFESQFEPQAWQQASQIYQDPLAKAGAYQQLGGAEQGLAGAYGGLGAQQQGISQGYTNLAGLYPQIAAQLGALSNAQTNTGQTMANVGSNLTSQALPWLAASAPTMPPQPSTAPLNIQPVNVSGLGTAYNQQVGSNYANQLAGYNAQLAQNQNMLSGLFGVGSGVIGGLAAGGLFSERSLKENIEPIGLSSKGIPLYRFNYKWGGPTLIGPMADEVEKLLPEAVIEVEGFKLVKYAMVL